MKRLFVLFLLPFMLFACSKKDDSRIYFVARTVPGANLHSIDMQKTLIRHTNDSGSREFDLTIDKDSNVFFTSNRILPEDRAKRAKIGKFGSRRQDLNVFYMPAGTEEEKMVNAATPIGKTDMPEALANMSPDGASFSFVRTLLPHQHRKKSKEVLQNVAVDQLYVQDGVDGTPKMIAQYDVIIKPQWSPDNKKLVYSAYDYTDNKAELFIYDVQTGKSQQVLESPWGINQIDSPQWSPDGQQISLILHPLEKNQLRTLYLLDLTSKELKRVSGEGHSVQSPVSWSSDGKQLVYDAYIYDVQDGVIQKPERGSRYTSHIFLVALDGMKTTQLTKDEQVIHSAPTFSPDDSLIAFLWAEERKSRRASLKVMNLKGEVIDTFHDNVNPGSPLVWH